jgi:flagellar hook protein FlgE
MTISSSLNASVSGLSSNASRLAGISDNIANSATNGYRRVETDFHSMVISNRQHAYAAGGVRSSQQRMIDQSGSLISTNNSTDLAVNGRGLLPVSDAAQIKVDNGRSPMKLTSTGSFRLDKDGYLSTTSGLTLLGWPAREDGSIPNYARDSSLDLEPIKINAQTLSGQPTTKMRVAVNLPATATMAGAAPSTEGISVEYFDNLGRPHSFEFTFTPVIPGADASNKWRMDITDSASQTALIGAYEMSFKDARNAGGTLNSITPLDSSPAYNASTGTVILNAQSGSIEVTIGKIADRYGMTQLSDSFTPVTSEKDGAKSGTMKNVEIDQAGNVFAISDTGLARRLYQVPLVNLPNINGLSAQGDETYLPSSSSGDYSLWSPGDGPTGTIVPKALEESTTDVATELTDMIRTQRAYSSNAKVIQTVDEMLQETTNLIR